MSLLLFLATVGCSMQPTAILTFSSDLTGNWDIFAIEASGDNLANLTQSADQVDSMPAWSPTGQLMAYVSDGTIRIADPDGNVLGSLMPESSFSDHPSWSPDGESIAFHSTMEGNFEIYTVHRDGQGLKRLTHSDVLSDSCPSWSPDGQHIAYGSGYGGGFELFIISLDGITVYGPLGSWGGGTCPPIDWSPNGDLLAFGGRQLRIIDWRASEETITSAECTKGQPDWSPDGQAIVFAGDNCTNDILQSHIYVASVNDNRIIQLTSSEFGAITPVWSPDGRRIAFISVSSSGRDIMVMDADGSNQQNLTSNDAREQFLVWKPN